MVAEVVAKMDEKGRGVLKEGSAFVLLLLAVLDTGVGRAGARECGAVGVCDLRF